MYAYVYLDVNRPHHQAGAVAAVAETLVQQPYDVRTYVKVVLGMKTRKMKRMKRFYGFKRKENSHHAHKTFGHKVCVSEM